MKLTIIILTIVLLISCNSADTNTIVETKNVVSSDTVIKAESIQTFKVDTTTLEGKREYLLNKFNAEHPISQADFDTYIDLTYDENKDYMIGYYGPTGTGIKNRIEIYIYNKITNNYILDTLLSELANPTFYIDQKKITGFYIGGGGGGGRRLEWIKNKWVVTKTFTVDNDNGKGLWVIKYPLKHKTDTIHREFQMIPPVDILETDVKE